MKTVRRALVALGATVLVTAFMRFRGSGGTPPRGGGWRELPATDLE